MPGAPASGFCYPGPAIASASRFFPDIQLLTFDFPLPIPDRYFFSAKSCQYYRILLHSGYQRERMGHACLRSLCEGLARGLVFLHSPPLLGRKPSSVKSRVSISSKLIGSKGLQLLYFGHLRKTGGGVTGWYTPRITSSVKALQLSPIILDIRRRMSAFRIAVGRKEND